MSETLIYSSLFDLLDINNTRREAVGVTEVNFYYISYNVSHNNLVTI